MEHFFGAQLFKPPSSPLDKPEVRRAHFQGLLCALGSQLVSHLFFACHVECQSIDQAKQARVEEQQQQQPPINQSINQWRFRWADFSGPTILRLYPMRSQ